MKYKCLFCANFAMPTSYATCENLSCFKKMKLYWQQKHSYKSVENAKQLTKKLSGEIKSIEAKRKSLRAAKEFIKTEQRMSQRRFS